MLDKNRLKLKYGDTKIMAIHNDDITATMDISHFKDGFMHKMYVLNMQKLFKNVSYLYRYDAEVDSDYKQPIPYVIFYHRPTKRFFYTERMQGDERLVGRKSLGIGRHVDDQEEFTSCLYREIKEEIGLRKEQIVDLSFKGFLLDSSNEVGSVHLGFLYLALIDTDAVYCREKDTLKGGFATLDELCKMAEHNEFETWSSIALKECILKEKF